MYYNPFFSVVIPTRNRSDMLKLSVSSLVKQTFKNFEIIVCDNSDSEQQALNLEFIQSINFESLRYIRPDKILSMPDNWEFALAQAKGLYQGILIDKTLLRKSALEEIYAILLHEASTDIFNYLNGGIEYHPKKIFKYRLKSYVDENSMKIDFFDPTKELKRRFDFSHSIRNEGKYYGLGKICFGFYSRQLIDKIKSQHERLFYPISCDYTSCALALAYAEKAILYEKILLYSINNYKGCGYLAQNQPGYILDFLKIYDPSLEFLKELPIPGLYSALHDFCAYDYSVLDRLNIGDYKVNKANLLERCQEDLVFFSFSSEKEYQRQWKLLSDYAKKQGIKEDLMPTSPFSDEAPNFFRSLIARIDRFLKKETTYTEKIRFLLKKIVFFTKFKGLMEID